MISKSLDIRQYLVRHFEQCRLFRGNEFKIINVQRIYDGNITEFVSELSIVLLMA